MKKILMSIGLITAFICCGASCSSTKEAANKSRNEVTTTIDQNALKEKGFSSGTIVYSDKEGDCEYTIAVDTGATFDPINLADEYKEDGITVWFTFRGLRMANRCLSANPVEINEMVKE